MYKGWFLASAFIFVVGLAMVRFLPIDFNAIGHTDHL